MSRMSMVNRGMLFALIVATGTVVPASQADGQCFVNPANGHHYVLLPEMRWTEAEAQAVAMGGHLVTINDGAELEWILNTVAPAVPGSGPEAAHIGFTDRDQEGQFVWTSGEPVTFTRWGAGEPNDAGGGEDFTGMDVRPGGAAGLGY